MSLIKFIIVGLLSTLVNFAVFSLSITVGILYFLAMPIGFMAGTLVSFFVNKVWTFEYTGTESRIKMHFALYTFSLLIGTLSIIFLVEIMLLSEKISFYLTLILTAATNFIGSKFWVFKDD